MVVPVLRDRKTITSYWKNKAEKPGEVANYQQHYNTHSLDGLPGLRSVRRRGALADARDWLYRVLARSAPSWRSALAVVCFAVGCFAVGVGVGVLRPDQLLLQRCQSLSLL